MKYFYTLILFLSLILFQNCTSKKLDHSSEVAVKEMTSLEGVLYRSRKEGWTTREKDNSDRKYSGEIKNGRPDGQGTATFYNGRINKGQWKNGAMDGHGIKIYKNGEKTKGVFKKGGPWNAIRFNKNNVEIARWLNGVKKSPKIVKVPVPKAVTIEAPAPEVIKVHVLKTKEQMPKNKEIINLKLYVHIMQDIEMNVKGLNMSNDHISQKIIENEILPELNKIWNQANINWELEGIYNEDVVKKGYRHIPTGYPKSFEKLKFIVEKARRDSSGKPDPRKLIPLFLFMQPENKIKLSEFGQNNFHIYLYPFIGNTSQGHAMNQHRETGNTLGFHTVVGTWTNKHNRGGIPERFKIVEDWDKWTKIEMGSISRTIAHELGHVLSLQHNKCEGYCLMGRKQGYKLTNKQISKARNIAKKRITNNCKSLRSCNYHGKTTFFNSNR